MGTVHLVKHRLVSTDPVVDDSTIQMVLSNPAATDNSWYATVVGPLQTFWNNAPAGGVNPISHYISQVMDRGASVSEFIFYDITGHLNGSPHGAPFATYTWTLGAAGTSGRLPEGVAATVSFRADYGSDVEFGSGTRPRSRDRNRFYLGPLTSDVLSNATSPAHSHFTSQFMTDCMEALAALQADLQALAHEVNFMVWSRKNAALKQPILTYMDDRPDYQRRRSDPSPGSRVSIGLGAP
jgi:hypothetical protein